MDQVNPEGVVAPVESVTPAASPEGQAPEAVQPAAAETPAAKPESDEPKGVAKRIKELTEARRAAEAREARLFALLEQRQAPAPQAAATEAKKTLADFGYDETKYAEYVIERAAQGTAEKARAEFERLQREREAQSRRAAFDARAEAFAKEVGDYADVIAGAWACSEPMAEVIEESDEGPALAYYLAQNPDEAAKLARMTAAKAGKELAKLEDRLVAERKKAAEKPVSRTPPPAPKIEASGDPGFVVDPTSPESDKLSDNEWAKLRNKQLRKRS